MYFDRCQLCGFHNELLDNDLCDECNDKLAKLPDVCPFDEPLHNHHDGCPSCYIEGCW